jgi:hypothetical protein
METRGLGQASEAVQRLRYPVSALGFRQKTHSHTAATPGSSSLSTFKSCIQET